MSVWRVVVTVPVTVGLRLGEVSGKLADLTIITSDNREMKSLRRLLMISKQVSARQKENTLRSSIGKKLLLTPFIMDNRETSLYLQEKVTKTIRRSKERNIRWMNVC